MELEHSPSDLGFRHIWHFYFLLSIKKSDDESIPLCDYILCGGNKGKQSQAGDFYPAQII
jgi:hypothetical protein